MATIFLEERVFLLSALPLYLAATFCCNFKQQFNTLKVNNHFIKINLEIKQILTAM